MADTHPHAPAEPEFARLLLLVNGRRGDLAERELRGTLARFPDDGRLHALLSLALVKQGKGNEAFAAAREALGLQPYHPWVNQAWAASHVLAGCRPGAEEAVREAMGRSPMNATLFGYLALANLNGAGHRFPARSRTADALEAAEAGLRLDPEHLDCLVLRAQALVRLGRTGDGRAAALQALRAAPEAAIAHAVYGVVELMERNRRQGYAHLTEALRLEPTNSFAHSQLQGQRGMIAMKLALEPWAWPLRIAIPLALALVPAGIAAGHWFFTLIGAMYLAPLHPDVLARVCQPELVELFRAPGALGPRDRRNALLAVLVCAGVVVLGFSSALTGWVEG